MNVIRHLPISPFPPHPVLSIGNFDGQHVGHRALVSTVVERARGLHGTPMVLTFDPHPARVLNPGMHLQFLSTYEEKLDFFQRCGVESLIVLEFTRELASLTPEQFVFKILKDGLGVRDIFVGENFVFGKKRSGNVQALIRLGMQANFRVHPVPHVQVDGAVVSSTRIRQCIQKGSVTAAARCLGRDYCLSGMVVRGEGRGAELGWPTANLRIPGDRVTPPDGVYVTTALINGELLKSVSYIGSRPTFREGERMLEVHLLDMNRSLYGEVLKVHFLERLRGDEKFSSVTALVRQMEVDANRARERLQVTRGESAKNSTQICS